LFVFEYHTTPKQDQQIDQTKMCFSPNNNIAEKHRWAILDIVARLEEQMSNLFDEKEEWDEGLYLEFNTYIQKQWGYANHPDFQRTSKEATEWFDNLWWTRWTQCRSEKGRADGWNWYDGDNWHTQLTNNYFQTNYEKVETTAVMDLHLRSMEQHGARKYFKRCWKFWGSQRPENLRHDEQGAYAAMGLEFITHKGKFGSELQILTRTKDERQYDMGIDPTIDTCYFLTPYDKKYGKEVWNDIWTTQRNHMVKHGIVSGIQRYDKLFGTEHGIHTTNTKVMTTETW